MRESSSGYSFGTANYQRTLQLLKQIRGKVIKTGWQPIEWFDFGPCKHKAPTTRCVSPYNCIVESDAEVSGIRTYYNQLWLRSLNCKGCSSLLPPLVAAYKKARSHGKSNKSLSSDILCICCPFCHAVIYAYYSLFPTKVSKKNSINKKNKKSGVNKKNSGVNKKNK